MKQGQGLIRFIAISMFLICLYYLSFTIVGTLFTKSENQYIASRTAHLTNVPTDSLRKIENGLKTAYRDSFSDKPFLDLFIVQYNYKNITKNQINLGLDLKGGMSFVLEVNQAEIIKSISNNSKDPIFNQALQKAAIMQQNSQDNFMTLLEKAYTEIDPKASMASVFASNPNYQGKIKPSDNNAQVIKAIEGDVNSAIGNTYNVIKSRINQFGVAEPIISLQEGAGRIIVELPGADDLPRIKKLLESSAKLEFWYTYDNREIAQSLVDANETLKGLESLEATSPTASNDSSVKDTATKSASILDKLDKKDPKAKDTADKSKKNPLFDLMSLNVDQKTGSINEGPLVGYCSVKDLEKVSALLAKEEIKKDIKGDVKFLWGAQPIDPNGKIYPLYAIKATTESAPLTGDAIASANQESDQYGKPGIGMVMTPQGAATWEKMTDLASSDPLGKKSIAIVLDNNVYSAPTVQNKISGGRSQITGKFSPEESKDLSNILNSGKIDAPAKIIQEEVVGPSLGKETINAGLISLLIGLIAILIYMIFLFRKPGGIADISLLVNLFFLLGVLASLKATLTLPGIAGIVLIIGAAVDANVIIFERIKEELRNGKSYWQGVLDGYRGSYWTIIDANATTLITSCTLMFFGYGPIKGFAYTLTIGIITSLFTAVLLTRDMFSIKQDKKEEVPFGQSFFDKYFLHSNFQFIGKRKIAYLFSMTFIVIGLVSIMTRGFDLGVDFKGGRSYVVTFDKNVDAPTIKKSLDAFDKNVVVKTYGSPNQVQITTAYLYGVKGETADLSKKNDAEVLSKVYEGVVANYTNKPSAQEFSSKYVNNFRKIDATIADDIRNSALWVSIIALLGIFAYVWLRFDRWQYSAGAIAALVHDLFFTLGLLSILKDIMPFSLEFNQSIIAAVLTIIGFSTNDTVVIFDRIREFVKKHPNDPLDKTINDAINGTLSRTVMTATTLFLVSMVLFFFGGESIRGFSFTMLIGIFVGTLSSIFVASPVALDLIRIFEKKKK